MFNLEIGQELEFIEPASVDGAPIAKGTRVRVGAIMAEVVEPKVTLVVLGTQPPQTLTVNRHVLTLHCRPLPKPR
jgi:hypothetical protein